MNHHSPSKNFYEQQLVDPPPSHTHRRNTEKRPIYTWKTHFIAGICGVGNIFFMHLWYCVIKQSKFTLNQLRPEISKPKLSSHVALWGRFDFNNTPLSQQELRSQYMRNRAKKTGTHIG